MNFMEVDIMCHIMFEILFLVLSCFLQGVVGEKTVCSEEGSPIECCANYKLNGEECTPCYGYFGPQCARSCTPGYCGFGCETKCLCEQCNQVNCSCIYDQGGSYPTENYSLKVDASHFSESFVIFPIAVVVGICLLTAILLRGYIIRCITSRNKKKDKDNQQSFTTMEPSISLHDFERATDNQDQTERQRQDRCEDAQEVRNNRQGHSQISMMYTNGNILFENDDPMFEYDLSMHIEY